MRKLRLFELTGLPGAEVSRARLGLFLEDMEECARGLEERRARTAAQDTR